MDQSFWNDFENQPPYEHEWKNIPDLIDMPTWNWYFNMTHFVLQGVQRGMYMNDSLNINDDCFGSKYVTKINQLTAMFQHGAMANIIPELAIIY